jgi:hypothetical protein
MTQRGARVRESRKQHIAKRRKQDSDQRKTLSRDLRQKSAQLA